MPDIAKILKFGSENHRKLLEEVNNAEDLWQSHNDTLLERMERADQLDRLYVSPEDHADLDKGTKTISELDFAQPIIVPYSKVCMETVLSILVQTFLTRRSLWSLVGRSPGDIEPSQVVQIDIDYQMDWTRSKLVLQAVLRDFLRYPHCVAQTGWRTETDSILSYRPVLDEFGFDTGKLEEFETDRHLFEGNEFRYVHPRQFVHDPRVPLAMFQEGQFAGRRVKMAYYKLLSAKYSPETGDGIYFNLKEALNSSTAKLQRRADDETANELTGGEALAEYSESRQDDKNPMCSITEMMIELVPSEYGLPWGDKPRKILVSVANEEVIVRCGRKPYGHNRFPFDAAQQQLDLEGLYSPSMLQTMEGLQDVANFQVNAHLESTLQQLRNLTFIDPRFVDENEFLNPSLNQVVRLGRSIPANMSIDSHIVHQQRLHVPTQSLLNDSGFNFDMMQRMFGATDTVQGTEGRNRTTARESNQRWHGSMRMTQALALSFGMQFIEPAGKKWVANTQHLRSVAEFRRILGEHIQQIGADENSAGLIQSTGNQQFVWVNPDVIRRAGIDIIPQDASRAFNVLDSPETMANVLSTMAASPVTAQIIAPGLPLLLEDWFRSLGFPNPERYFPQPNQQQMMMQQMMQAQQQNNPMAMAAPDQNVLNEVQAGNLVQVPQTVQ